MRVIIRILCVLGLAAFCVSCGGGGGGAAPVSTVPPPASPPPPAGPLTVTVDVAVKQLNFSWTELPGSTHYRLLENPDGGSGFTQVGADIPAGTLSVSLAISVHMFDFARALYIVEGCDAAGCTGSTEVNVMNDMLSAIGRFEHPDPADIDGFGDAVALSSDGTTLAVGAASEASNATGIDGDQNDNSASGSGAAYVFRFDGTDWFQQAYIKASNAEGRDPSNGDFDPDRFGSSVALSADGNTLAVGAGAEASSATGIGGDQNDNSAEIAGAVYLFRFNGTDWFQQAYVKASNTDAGDQFGADAVALSADGNTLAVGARLEDSSATGINGDDTNNAAEIAGAVYLFRFDGTDWFQQAYVKASNTDAGDRFGRKITLSADGAILAVAAGGEQSTATGIGGDQNDNSAESAGAVYVFRFDGTDWLQEAYVKASNTDAGDGFGRGVALSADGAILAVAADGEQSSATGIGGDQNDNSALAAGAAYIFRFDGTNWIQQAYVKASNTNVLDDQFGRSIALSSDGIMLAVGARQESSCAAGVGGDQNDISCSLVGAAYVFRFDGTDWAQTAYVKPPNPVPQNQFGRSIALNADGATLAVGTGVAGAVYLY